MILFLGAVPHLPSYLDDSTGYSTELIYIHKGSGRLHALQGLGMQQI